MNKPTYRHFVILTITVVLLTLGSSAQQSLKTYEKEWKNADALAKKGLPQSALAEVKKIYTLAKKENQDAQVIKSLVYMTSLQQETRESNIVLAIKELEKEINENRGPAVSILNSLLASLYWTHYSYNRWKLYSRTETVGFKKDDIETWSTEDFHRRISELFLRSIEDKKLLQQTKLAPFDAIIIKGNVRHLRPTLYDLLAHRALGYFENDERNIKKPAYAFEIDQASAFDPAADFIRHRFTTRDSLSLQHKALLIYQELIAFHINDPKPDALIDADIQRIEFVKQKSVHPDAEQLYLNAVNHIARQYENVPAAAQAWYLMAAHYSEKASGYNPHGDTTHRFDYIKSKEICEKVVKQKVESEGKANCFNLLNEITRNSLQFYTEKVNVPGQPFRVLMLYKNVNRLHLRILRADAKLKKQLEANDHAARWSSINAAKPLRSWEQALPDARDYQEHRAEIKIDELPAGEYVLVASTNKNLPDGKTAIGARLFYVSSISFVNYDNHYFVLGRDNGRPLANAAVKIWKREYDYRKSEFVSQHVKEYTTNANGYFFLDVARKDNDTYNRFFLEISHGNDHLFPEEPTDYYYQIRDTEAVPVSTVRDIEDKTYTWLFTDRSLYRPGQTVFIKGIAIVRDKPGKSYVREKYKTQVYLYNANYEKTDSIDVETNEYGSFSGKFQLPQGVLNGQFHIQMKLNKGNADIRVEEYKRPKFYVEYEPLKGTYKVNDTINVTGIAKAYAGNNIGGATVTYRIVRQPRFIYPWLFSRWWMPTASPLEIAHGEVTTDQDGKFKMTFTAIPDRAVDKKFEPVFDYTLYANVTDINGETRSGQKTVSVSYKSLLLQVTVNDKLPADSLNKLSIRTENMNGEFEPAIVNVKITRLKEEKRLLRQRFWERPDQFVMSKTDYTRYFPHDIYDNENDYTSWEKGAVVFEKSDSARSTRLWTIGNRKWEPGMYVIEISTKDKYGQDVKDVKHIELYDDKSKTLPLPQYAWSSGTKPIEPGETTTLTLGTSADSVFLIEQRIKSGAANSKRNDSFSFLTLNNEKKPFNYAATEEDRGGYGIVHFFVKHNRIFQLQQMIDIPWTNKDLQIEYATFRDKTLPGSEEKWKIKLTGYKNEKVAAEMLAGMYDASLDQFYSHEWAKPGIWPNNYNIANWTGQQNFGHFLSTIRPANMGPYKSVDILYDGIIGGEFGRVLPWAGLAYEMYFMRHGMTKSRTSRNIEALGNESFHMNIPAEKATGIRSELHNDRAAGEYKRLPGQNAVGYAMPSAPPSVEVDADGALDQADKPQTPGQEADVQIRKNFNETAFFFPDLRTDENGAIEFSFTLPEALTRWKFQALAHTKELAFGYSSKEIITQKQLMVQPNTTRFVREGDKMEFSTKIVNLSEQALTGQAELQLMDAATNQPVNTGFKNTAPLQPFTVAAGQSAAIKFPVEIPDHFTSALTWRIVARASSGAEISTKPELSDGEEDVLPVLTDRMLVTESLPLYIRGNGSKRYTFDKLVNSGNSNTLQHQSLVVEYTSNPAWYAVQALPYMMEFPYECAEQLWNRYYANALATMIANSSHSIKKMFEQWATKDTAALLSNLQKNEELKSVLLQETPWVLQAKSEAEQKRNLALLLDMAKMSSQLAGSYERLKQMQSSNGGFVWFKGGPDDRFITQYIVSGIGHLKKLGAIPGGHEANLQAILATALPYLDKKLKEEYDDLRETKNDLKDYVPGYYIIQYLYMRSFFPDVKIASASRNAYDYFRERAQKTWTRQNKYMQGMTALALHRSGDGSTPAAILRSLKETSVNNEELGMYWKDVNRGWWWYEAPIERQALLIEAFIEIGNDTRTADDLRTWLLKNKQTNRWESTKATAEACYALLLQGTQWLTSEPEVTLQMGAQKIASKDFSIEKGTGYFKKTMASPSITAGMGNVELTVTKNQGSASSWGAIYWQYFENMDKITPGSTSLKLEKKLFVETNTDRGPVLNPVNEGATLKVGDKIKVRIELRVDRDMEYVHMKDMRAAGMEPVNVLSSYKWQGGLGYYETTKDASTNFFFNYLRKGTYVFEYPLFVTHTGNFSNGITSIQCMYAPEFSSHSEGLRINVK